MEIVFHLGAHCTDDNVMVRTLRLNAGRLAEDGVLIPEPQVYRNVLREGMRRHEGQRADADMQAAMLETILDGLTGRRVVFSNENFICTATYALARKGFYDRIGEKALWLRNLFPDNPVEFHIAMRDPASMIPALYARDAKDRTPQAFINRLNIAGLSWLPVLEDISRSVPDCWITTWCNEDTPLIMPEVLQAMTDHGGDLALENGDALMKKLLSDEGLTRMRGYLDANPPKTVHQRRDIMIAFFDKYGRPGAMEETADLPGWTEDITDVLSETYDSDQAAIAALPNVEVIT